MSYKPTGHPSISPYFSVSNPEATILFLKDVFGGVESSRQLREDGSIRHAEVRIDDSLVMIGGRDVPTSNVVHVYVRDVDAVYARALRAGAREVVSPRAMPYGDKVGGFTDLDGNTWWIATHEAK